MSRFRFAPVLLAAIAAASAASAQTIGHWRFEGDAASFTADSGGNGRTLTFPSAATTPAQVSLPAVGAGSKFHNPLPQTASANLRAASFDGGDRATAADDAAFTNGAFTVEAYIHPTAIGSATQFVTGHFDSGANQRSWALVIASGRLSLYLSSTGAGIENVASSFTIGAGKDYYVAAAVNLADTSSAGATIYCQNLTDGGPLNSEALSHSSIAVQDSTAPFSIGATANATSPFNGVIDEVRVTGARLSRNQLLAANPNDPDPSTELPTANGFRGIWYSIGPTGNQYGYKYSGGMATYPQQHVPIAVYSAQAQKTFFVYGGTDATNSTLLHMISYYDHVTRRVARPRILLDKATTDAHDNPVLSIDDAGHLWIFSNTHGEARRSYLHRSVAPFQIERFVQVTLPTDVFPLSRFSYGQPWWVPGRGFLFPHIRYNGGDRDLYWTTSSDGMTWSPRGTLSQMLEGQYQVSGRFGEKIGTAFDVHPPAGGSDGRTNLYYLETANMGATWSTASGTPMILPLTDPANAALVRDYMAEGKLVYMKDVAFDAAGKPVILYLTATSYLPGPLDPPRMLHTARWTGMEWLIRDVFPTDHDYDHGSLYLEGDGTWRIVGTFIDGPQRYGTGGEMGAWTSGDQGATWQLHRQLTTGSLRNHNYPRRPAGARDDFYALWADGNAFSQSTSSLFFTDRNGDAVLRLPIDMSGSFAFPEVVSVSDPEGDADGDGASNEREYFAGTDPREPRSVLRFEQPEIAAGGAFRLSFTTATGKQYRVLYKDDLTTGNWLILTQGVPGTGALVSVQDPAAVERPKRFYRVEVMD